jgi:hypothetical protein
LLPEDCALDEPYGGWIVNASRSGVCLLVPSGTIAEGTILQLRRPGAAKQIPWVPVRVKYRCQREGVWELGCEFLRPHIHETAVLFKEYR